MSARLLGLLIDVWAAFFVAHSTVQYLPNQAAKFVGNYRNGVLVSETWHIAAIENLEDASLVFDRLVGGLLQNAPHVTVTMWRATAVVHFGALLTARTCADPRREMLLGRKCRRGGTDFGDDLLRRIST